MNRLKNKSGQPLITQGIVCRQYVPLPPAHEQQEITRMLSAIDEKTETEEKRKATLQALFRTMLHHLMTGKVRVKDMEAKVS